MGNVNLLDCTLGVGGKLNQWKYGETIIRQTCMLLGKSGVDIVELGLLRRQVRGIEHAIFAAPLLPLGLNRQQGQLYSMLLDENYPPISELPDQGDRTIDIIRVEVSRKNLSRALQYSGTLLKKGYRVSILITETAQYTRVELAKLLREINALCPWSCVIYDGSGVMSAEELRSIFTLYDEVLRKEITVGFHGCDSQGTAMDLAKLFVSMETERERFIDASIAGMGVGALHLSSKKIAEWLNQKKQKSYDLSIIAYLEDFMRPMLEPKRGSGARMLYCGAAQHRCSYRYTEYYSGLSVEAAEQLDIFAEIAPEDAFRFSPMAANQALSRYRKKLLNLIIAVPTANRSEEINTLLSASIQELLRYGIDMVILDSSNEERTHAVVKNFQLQGYTNLYYQKNTVDSSVNGAVKLACRTYGSYDYLWILHDRWIPTPSHFYQDLLGVVQTGAEYITVDSSFRNSGQYVVKFYEDCLDYFEDNSVRIAVLGSLILKRTAADMILKQCSTEEEIQDFWLPSAVFRELSSGNMRAATIISGVFQYNGSPASVPEMSLGEDVLNKWVDSWQNIVKNLPNVYNPGKADAMRVQMFDFHPFHTKSMLCLRGSGQFSLSIYQGYREALIRVSDTPKWKFYVAASIPRWMARAILAADSSTKTKPQSRFSRLIKKLRDTFIRLGA